MVENEGNRYLTGFQFGFDKTIIAKLWGWWEIPITVRATNWGPFWSFESAVDLFVWPTGFRIGYNRIDDTGQFMIMFGKGIHPKRKG